MLALMMHSDEVCIAMGHLCVILGVSDTVRVLSGAQCDSAIVDVAFECYVCAHSRKKIVSTDTWTNGMNEVVKDVIQFVLYDTGWLQMINYQDIIW